MGTPSSAPPQAHFLSASVLLTMLACARSGPAQGLATVSSESAVDCSERVERARAAADLPALAVSLAIDGQIVAWGAAGERIAGSGELVTRFDQWHIGSDTKAMTAHLAALSVARGELEWDTSVAEVFAELQPAEGWETVTLLDLVQHRSGLPQLSSTTKQYMLVMHTQPTDEVRRRWVEKKVLPHAPHESREFRYTNSNYMLAGAMLEARTGQSWEALLHERIFTEYEMKGAGIGVPGSGQPRGHRRDPDGQWVATAGDTSADNAPAVGPAGTVHIDHISWTAFLHAQLEIIQAGDAADPALSQLFIVPDGTPYAGGWIHLEEPPEGLRGPAWTHGGSNGMWLALATLLPEYGASFLCTSNAFDSEAMGPECSRLMAELIHEQSSDD